MNMFCIPLRHREGKYRVTALNSTDQDALTMTFHNNWLSFEVPGYQKRAEMFALPEELETLTAAYDKEGMLSYVEKTENNRTRLVYIRFADDEAAKEQIWQLVNFCADRIIERLMKTEGIARLFIEHFYDGQAVDVTAKFGTDADRQEIIARYGDVRAIDNSGDYPSANRLECDNHTLGAMLQCTSAELAGELYGFAVYILKTRIEKCIPALPGRTKDFRFFVQEYD